MADWPEITWKPSLFACSIWRPLLLGRSQVPVPLVTAFVTFPKPAPICGCAPPPPVWPKEWKTFLVTSLNPDFTTDLGFAVLCPHSVLVSFSLLYPKVLFLTFVAFLCFVSRWLFRAHFDILALSSSMISLYLSVYSFSISTCPFSSIKEQWISEQSSQFMKSKWYFEYLETSPHPHLIWTLLRNSSDLTSVTRCKPWTRIHVENVGIASSQVNAVVISRLGRN